MEMSCSTYGLEARRCGIALVISTHIYVYDLAG
jgi:hypothetical protein